MQKGIYIKRPACPALNLSKALSLPVLSGSQWPVTSGEAGRGRSGHLTHSPSRSSVGLEWRLSDLNCNSAAMEARRSFSGTLEPLFQRFKN